MSVTPPQALCPHAALHITATIVADGGPGELELRWRLPDGSTADSQTFAFDGGRRVLRAAIDLTLTGREQLLGEVVAVVGPGRRPGVGADPLPVPERGREGQGPLPLHLARQGASRSITQPDVVRR